MASPSEMIGWECGACTYTNDDCTRRDCHMCTMERPKRYFVVPDAGVSATARTTTVDRREQVSLAALRDVVQEAPSPVDEEPIAEGVPVVPVQGAVAAVPSGELCSSVWWGLSSTSSGQRRTTGAALVPVTPAADHRWWRDPRWHFVVSSLSFATSERRTSSPCTSFCMA
jgi:hypothetical protein